MPTKKLTLKRLKKDFDILVEPVPPLVQPDDGNRRLHVQVGAEKVEVIIDPAGKIVGADDTLEDWIGDPWVDLETAAKDHNWAITDPVAERERAEQVRKAEQAAAELAEEEAEWKRRQEAQREAAEAKKGKGMMLLPKKPPDFDPNQFNTKPSAWNADSKTLSRMLVDAEKVVEDLRRERAIALAKEGVGIDAMNAALFPPTPQPTDPRAMFLLVESHVCKAVEEVFRRYGLPGADFERFIAAVRQDLRREFDRAQAMAVRPTRFDGWDPTADEPSRIRGKGNWHP